MPTKKKSKKKSSSSADANANAKAAEAKRTTEALMRTKRHHRGRFGMC